MAQSISLALLGADSALGESIIRLLDESGPGLDAFFPLCLGEPEGVVALGGEEHLLQSAQEFDWSRANIVLAADRSPAAERWLSRAREAGCRILGGALATDGPAIPQGVASAVHHVLKPLLAQGNLLRLDMTAILPVALAGQAGVEELAGQSRALFALEETEAEVFPLRVAFNVIPQVGSIREGGNTDVENAIARDVRLLLNRPDLPMLVTACWVPVFHGGSLVLQGQSSQVLDLSRLRQGFAQANTGITLMDEGIPGGVPTPATDAVDSEGVFVGRLRVDPLDPHHFACWAVADIFRLEAANIVGALENLIEKSADSVLT